MREFGLVIIFAGVMMFGISFVTFRSSKGVLDKLGDDDPTDKETFARIIKGMAWGMRAVAVAAALAGLVIYALFGGFADLV